jgi:hypothetical protein
MMSPNVLSEKGERASQNGVKNAQRSSYVLFR